MLGQRELARTVLPVGEMTKLDVRDRAAQLDLRTAEKPESMDVCFIRRGQRAAFIGARMPTPRGVIVDGAGAVVGRHDGIDRFTIGQRRGLGVARGERRYVVDIDAASATVTIGPHQALLRDAVVLRDLTFVGAARDDAAVDAQVRAHGAPVAARLSGATIRFEVPQPRVAPGQTVALYHGDEVIGGGIAT
jgi:tRNA-specific 2-thiouridylase